MTIVHECKNNHRIVYELYDNVRYNVTKNTSEQKWRCPTCKEGLLTSTFIDDNPLKR